MPSDDSNTPPAEARTFTRRELGLILQRAAEQQAAAEAQSDSGFSMMDIRQIAGEVGIDARHVDSAAIALRSRRQASSSYLGAPWRFRFEETFEGEISGDLVAALIDVARNETMMQGTVSESLDSIVWSARDTLGATIVQVTRRGGRTTIAVLSARTDAAASVGIAGATVSLGATIAAGVSLALASPVAVAMAVAAGAGSWLLTRAAWRRLAARYSGNAEHLMQSLASALAGR